jgi:IS5 family transposase
MSSQAFQQSRSLNDWLIADHQALHALDDLEALFDWPSFERPLTKLYPSREGRPSHPLLMMFRILLLEHLYKITSDVQMESMLARDLLFRRFCGLSADQQPPSHDTISRFRRKLAAQELWENMLEKINAQLITKGILIREGQVSIMDATVVEAHQTRGETKDPEAGWCVKEKGKNKDKEQDNGKKTSTYGYKVHSNCDEDGFILRQKVTSGEVYDGNVREALLTGEETQLYADSVYDSKSGRAVLAERGIENRVQRKGCKHKKLTAADHAYNQEVGVMRAKIEHQFAEYKERYGLRRTRFMGQLMNATHAGLAAIAHNMKKGARFYQLYGLPEPTIAG